MLLGEESGGGSRRKILQRLKSVNLGGADERVTHFPKKPDFLLVHDEDIAQRQHQLQTYLNSILQCHAYRNMPETVRILIHLRYYYSLFIASPIIICVVLEFFDWVYRISKLPPEYRHT